MPDSPAIEAQAHSMLSKLTLEQKIELLGGINSMYTRPMPAIDLPRFKMSDASVGVRTWGPTTAYAGGSALAASWDTDLARKIGASLGRDARARNVNFLLGPGVNIARSPINGRNFEYLSEDPYLNASMVVPFIEGVQSEGVIATVKHYALNDQEFNRHNASADVDERTMREIYLPAFEAAVTKAHVDAVMNSYNLVNGVHATQNDFLNLQVLKGEWGFQGVLMSDWDATYDGVAACNNGLDLEMPSPKFMNAKNLVPAVQAGQVKESTIDEHVLRLLRAELRYGFTTRPQFDPADSTYSLADRPLALEEALESITLLKNEGNLLPLDPAKIKNIAIIGPNVYPAVTGGGGSSEAHAFEPVSILTGIANLLGPDAHVFYSPGMPDTDDEKKAVAQADVVIVAVGFTAATEREGHDRTFTLPAGQDALVEQVVAANPRTIVLLTGGGGMDLSRWIDKVPALLHLYYPGQEGGTPSRRFSSASTIPRANSPSPSTAVGKQARRRSGTTAIPKTTPRCTPPARTASRRTTPSSTSSTATSSWSATVTGPPPAAIRSSPSATGSATPRSNSRGSKRPPPRPLAPQFQSASTSPTPAAWPEPKSRNSTSPTPPRRSIAPSAN